MFVYSVFSFLAIFSLVCAQQEHLEAQDVCKLCDCTNTSIICTGKRLQQSFLMNDTWPAPGNVTSLIMDLNAIAHIHVLPPMPLKTLSFRYNEVMRIDALAFYNLTELEELDLSHNHLDNSDLTAEIFEGHFSPDGYNPIPLLSLNLSHNFLDGLDQNLLEHVPRLQRLFLAHNLLADERGTLDRYTTIAVCSVDKLQVLDLTATGLSHLPETFLANLPKLEELILADNYFHQIPVEPLSYARSLQILNFNNNPMQLIASTDKMRSLDTLKQLHISSMPDLIRIEEDSLSGLTSLAYLDCKMNQKLEHISEKALNASNLTRIDLNDNNLRYIPENLVPDWSVLKHVDFRGNPITCDCNNQWMIRILVHRPYMRSDGLLCKAPEEMLGQSLESLHDRNPNYDLRCLDNYGNRPERDSTFLVVTFAIVVVVLVTVGIVWKLKGGRCRQGREIDYTAIYQQAVRDEEKY